MEQKRDLYRVWLDNLKGDNLGHLGVDGKFLKWSLEEIVWEAMNLNRITQNRELNLGLIKSNEPWRRVKCVEILDKLSFSTQAVFSVKQSRDKSHSVTCHEGAERQ